MLRYLMKSIVIAIAILSSQPAIADIKRPETIHDTLVVMLDAIQSNEHIQSARIDWVDKSIVFDLALQNDLRASPDNLHRTLQGADTDRDRQQILDTFIHNFVEGIIDTQQDNNKTADILPVVRHESYGQGVDLPAQPLSLPFIADMRIFFVHDLETSLAYITSKDLEELNLTVEELRHTALENFTNWDWTPQIEGDGVYFLSLDGTYESSFLLDTDLWEQIDEQLGEIILVAPSRDLIVFIDNTGVDGRGILKGVLEEFSAKVAYPLSDAILVWNDGQWEIAD